MITFRLRTKINIGKEAYFIAAGDTFQIWDPDTYEKDQSKAEIWLNSFPEDFDPLTFLDEPGAQL